MNKTKPIPRGSLLFVFIILYGKRQCQPKHSTENFSFSRCIILSSSKSWDDGFGEKWICWPLKTLRGRKKASASSFICGWSHSCVLSTSTGSRAQCVCLFVRMYLWTLIFQLSFHYSAWEGFNSRTPTKSLRPNNSSAYIQNLWVE